MKRIGFGGDARWLVRARDFENRPNRGFCAAHGIRSNLRRNSRICPGGWVARVYVRAVLYAELVCGELGLHRRGVQVRGTYDHHDVLRNGQGFEKKLDKDQDLIDACSNVI